MTLRCRGAATLRAKKSAREGAFAKVVNVSQAGEFGATRDVR
jgi:hypothetical protein